MNEGNFALQLQLRLVAFGLLLIITGPSSICGNAAIITSVNYAFETFSPYALIRFFEFSDREWNITQTCFRDMYVYVQGLRNGEYWAVKLYDATSYYAGAAFSGTTVRLHNPNLCRFLSQQHNDIQLQYTNPNYKLFALPFDVHLISGHFLMEVGYDNYFRFEKVQQMICFPKSCTNTDLEQIFEVYLFQTTNFVRNVTYVRHRIVTEKYRIYEDFNFYILVIMIFGSLLIHLTVYLLRKYMIQASRSNVCQNSAGNMEDKLSQGSKPSPDNILINLGEWKSTLGSVDLKQFTMARISRTEPENTPIQLPSQSSLYFEELLDSMSLSNVIYNLIQSTSTPLCGMMFIFSLAFILLHLINEYSFLSNNLDLGMIQNRVKQRDVFLKRSIFLMDIYFLINGANLSYHFFSTLPKDKLYAFGQLKHVLKLVIYKIVGLTPSYTFALYASLLLDKYFFYNITLEIPSRDYKNCAQNQIFNVFYMDTLFPLTERCMPWTWFIALKMQFYMGSCLLMLLVKLQFYYAMIMGASIVLFSTVAASLWIWGTTHHYGYTTTLLYDLTHFNLVLDNICLFVIPYMLGVYLGHTIHRTNHNLQLNLFFFIAGWLLVVSLLVFYVYGTHLLTLHFGKWLRALFAVLTHLVWNCIIFWTIISALSNYGDFIYKLLSFKYANALEKLTPINVLIAPVIIRIILFTGDVPIFWSSGQIISMFMGCLLATYICSLAIYVLLDGPLMAALESLLAIRRA